MSKKKESTHSIKRVTSYTFAGLIGIAGVFGFAYVALPALLSVSYTQGSATATMEDPAGEKTTPPVAVHIMRPEPMKAIYLSQCVAGTHSFRDSLVKLIDDTDLNAVVIDIRDY